MRRTPRVSGFRDYQLNQRFSRKRRLQVKKPAMAPTPVTKGTKGIGASIVLVPIRPALLTFAEQLLDKPVGQVRRRYPNQLRRDRVGSQSILLPPNTPGQRNFQNRF